MLPRGSTASAAAEPSAPRKSRLPTPAWVFDISLLADEVMDEIRFKGHEDKL
jgi:hypothetical protein